MSEFRLPKKSQRVTVVGRTGSGKTWAGAWLLSVSALEEQPFIIVDYKGDELLNSIENIRQIGLGDKLPKRPGLYIVKPLLHEEAEVEAFLWEVWKKENVGLYFDEAFMLPNSGHSRRGALQAILTQGRSKHIPVIALVQRPSQITAFLFSEADYYMLFHLNREPDRKTMLGYADGLRADDLPPYYSRWFDVGNNELFLMQPVPDGETIAEKINSRLEVKRRFI